MPVLNSQAILDFATARDSGDGSGYWLLIQYVEDLWYIIIDKSPLNCAFVLCVFVCDCKTSQRMLWSALECFGKVRFCRLLVDKRGKSKG